MPISVWNVPHSCPRQFVLLVNHLFTSILLITVRTLLYGSCGSFWDTQLPNLAHSPSLSPPSRCCSCRILPACCTMLLQLFRAPQSRTPVVWSRDVYVALIYGRHGASKSCDSDRITEQRGRRYTYAIVEEGMRPRELPCGRLEEAKDVLCVRVK